MACLPLPREYFVDIDKLIYNDFSSCEYWQKVFSNKMPCDSIYQALELYSAGIRAKELKQKIKAGKIKRVNHEPPRGFKAYSQCADSSEQFVCESVGRPIEKESCVVRIQRGSENSKNPSILFVPYRSCFTGQLVRCELDE